MSIHELKEKLKLSLEKQGKLDELRAQLRSLIYLTLEPTDEVKPKTTHINFLITELIRDYMKFNNYNHSLSVFEQETGQHSELEDRETIANQLNLQNAYRDNPQYPLLYSIVALLEQHKSSNASPKTKEIKHEVETDSSNISIEETNPIVIKK